MRKIYCLSTCSTCTRIIKQLNLGNEFDYQDIKSTKITELQLDEMAKLSGSYESLFSRKAVKYKLLKLSEKTLTEAEYKKLILEEYTFLKRPVIIVSNKIFIGNSKETINNATIEIQNIKR